MTRKNNRDIYGFGAGDFVMVVEKGLAFTAGTVVRFRTVKTKRGEKRTDVLVGRKTMGGPRFEMWHAVTQCVLVRTLEAQQLVTGTLDDLARADRAFDAHLRSMKRKHYAARREAMRALNDLDGENSTDLIGRNAPELLEWLNVEVEDDDDA